MGGPRVFVAHRVNAVYGDSGKRPSTWQSCQRDLSDEEWELIADLVPTFSGPGRIGRPARHSKRDIVNAIYYVAATGCQWRALPDRYPNWNTCIATTWLGPATALGNASSTGSAAWSASARAATPSLRPGSWTPAQSRARRR